MGRASSNSVANGSAKWFMLPRCSINVGTKTFPQYMLVPKLSSLVDLQATSPFLLYKVSKVKILMRL